MIEWIESSTKRLWTSSIGEIWLRACLGGWTAYHRTDMLKRINYDIVYATPELAKAAVVEAERAELQRRAELIDHIVISKSDWQSLREYVSELHGNGSVMDKLVEDK